MPMDFHKDMDKYLTSKRRKRTFSEFKSNIMNKKSNVSNKTTSRFGQVKDQLASKIYKIKKKGTDKKPGEDITINQITELVEKKGTPTTPIKQKEETPEPKEELSQEQKEPRIKQLKKYIPDLSKTKNKIQETFLSVHRKIKEQKRKKDYIKTKDKEGWAELKTPDAVKEQAEKQAVDLSKQKEKLEKSIQDIQKQKESEKSKLSKLAEENLQRKHIETDEERKKRLELEEDIKVLKEKQRIEEERLAQIRRARKIEQREALGGKVKGVLFRKKPAIKEDIKIDEPVKEETKPEVKEEKKEVKEEEKHEIKEKKAEHKEEPKPEAKDKKEAKKDKEEKKIKKKKRRKSFFSKFIQIKTAEEIAKEEAEHLNKEENEMASAQSDINKMLVQGSDESRTNEPPETKSDFSNIVAQAKERLPRTDDTIHLDDDYKIKVVKNKE
ncbi:MAG: hypothetical protein U9O94_03945 [Nanoarchaeota archaeon]|nr:hypothetical protein [Nanoarchaeota archaeon]